VGTTERHSTLFSRPVQNLLRQLRNRPRNKIRAHCKQALDKLWFRIYVLVMFTSFKQIWDDVLARNSQALALVVAELLAVLAAYGGTEAVSLPRAVHVTIIRVLRPAESALRRLILIAARDVTVKAAKPPMQPRSSVAAAGNRTSPRMPESRSASRMAFQLFDPRKRFNLRRVRYTKLTPRIYFIAPKAPFAPLFQQPAAAPVRPPIPSASDRLISARRLCLRLKALSSALEDIPRQARRLVRVRMRRETQQPPRLFLPLRTGKPPGHRNRPSHEIDDILADCHKYALGVLCEQKPNTS
jgi:hypothetical protein